jgi:hypothetical protein
MAVADTVEDHLTSAAAVPAPSAGTYAPNASGVWQTRAGSTPEARRGGIVCREIRETDLPVVADLLLEGFPDRGIAYWCDGLRCMRLRT